MPASAHEGPLELSRRRPAWWPDVRATNAGDLPHALQGESHRPRMDRRPIWALARASPRPASQTKGPRMNAPAQSSRSLAPRIIQVSPGFDVPVQIVPKKIGIVGQTGSGKSNTARVFVEAMIRAGA